MRSTMLPIWWSPPAAASTTPTATAVDEDEDVLHDEVPSSSVRPGGSTPSVQAGGSLQGEGVEVRFLDLVPGSRERGKVGHDAGPEQDDEEDRQNVA